MMNSALQIVATLERQLEPGVLAYLLKTVDVLHSLREQHTLVISAVEQEKIKLANDVDQCTLCPKPMG